jgi:hypothetical protein
MILFVFGSIFYIWKETYDLCLLQPGLLHLTSCSTDPYICLRMTKFHSPLWLNKCCNKRGCARVFIVTWLTFLWVYAQEWHYVFIYFTFNEIQIFKSWAFASIYKKSTPYSRSSVPYLISGSSAIVVLHLCICSFSS